MHRVILADWVDEPSAARLAVTCEVIRIAPADEAALIAAAPGCAAIVGRTTTPITRAVLEAGIELRVVGVAGVGVDHVDLAAAAERGVRVVHTPAASTEAVAELAVFLMQQLLRPFPALADAYRQGNFKESRKRPHGDELREQTVGIIGMGRIGSRVGRILAAGFGARVLYNDIAPVGPFDFACTAVDKALIWSEADIVTLHVPLTPNTTQLIDAESLAWMKRGARLINTARGKVVGTDAVVAALTSSQLAGVGLDVTEPEPLAPDHPLFKLPNAILTPHIAARTHGGAARMWAVVDEVARILAETA